MENDDNVGLGPIALSNQEDNEAIQELETRLQSMRSCYQLMRQNGFELQRALTDFELSLSSSSPIVNKSSAISEKSALFGIAAHAMLDSCNNYLNSAESEALKMVKLLQSEKIRTRKLEKMIHDVAKDHTFLERRTTRFSQLLGFPGQILPETLQLLKEQEEEDRLSNIDDSRDGQDTIDLDLSDTDSLTTFRQSIFDNAVQLKQRSLRYSDDFPMQTLPINIEEERRSLVKGAKRRSRVPDRPNVPFSAWSILKNNIGKDLSKVPMPVNFNEPLSLLQRLTEEFEYWELLDTAAKMDDKFEQLAYLAAFSISIYSNTANRTGKPFNPLLGETYEFDRSTDLGWRSIAEQVSHHPPVSVIYCQGKGWTFWQDYGMTTKFRGKNLEVRPIGSSNCRFHRNGYTYTWNKVSTLVNNIIVGKMWIDQQGKVDIVGLKAATGLKCELTFLPYSVFSSGTQRHVNGLVKDENDNAQLVIKGVWDSKVEIAPVLSTKIVKNETTYKTDNFKTIWQRTELDPENFRYHYFSKFTCELNELEEGIPPTDSRLRPDVRLMEEGQWDQSNYEKLRLEEKQRKKRIKPTENKLSDDDANQSSHQPLWFDHGVENDKDIFSFKGTYWTAKLKQDWSQCPDIF